MQNQNGDEHKLHKLFTRPKHAQRFFKIGKVFTILWSEPAGDTSDTMLSSSSSASSSVASGISACQFGERVFTKIRRLVVVREGKNYSVAIQINTYSGRGVARRGTVKSEHAIIHTGRSAPQPAPDEQTFSGEAGLRDPIRVDPDLRNDKLDPRSRLNFGKVYTIEHNVKVRSFGMVHRNSLPALLNPFLDLFNKAKPFSAENVLGSLRDNRRVDGVHGGRGIDEAYEFWTKAGWTPEQASRLPKPLSPNNSSESEEKPDLPPNLLSSRAEEAADSNNKCVAVHNTNFSRGYIQEEARSVLRARLKYPVREKGNYGTALRAASFGGRKKVVELLLEHGADVNAKGSDDGTALQAASYKGHEKVAELLLEHGADVNAEGGGYGTALQAASYNGHEKVAELLLEKGADVNAEGGGNGTALQAASYNGHEMVAELLLEKGARVNAEGGENGTALQATSYNGHEMVAGLLLSHGADVNSEGGENGTALQAASYNGHKKVVELLLEKGADVNAEGGENGTALQTASYNGHEMVAGLLLSHGADVNSEGGENGTALRIASYVGHEKVVELLLEHGADVNANRGIHGTALQAASYDGHAKVAELLLEYGADVNAEGGRYGTALRAALYNDYEKVVELLLEHGADVNAKGSDDGTALQAASYNGYEKVVELLLEHGADVNAEGGGYGTALRVASFVGHESVVELLLEHGADVNARGSDDGTALQAASYNGHEKVAELLLEHGADVNAEGGENGTPLRVALSGGYEKVAELLLQHGADANVKGSGNSTALQAASQTNYEMVVEPHSLMNMRLLNVHTLEFHEFFRDVPKYVVASHRWIVGSEARLQDVQNRCNTNRSGYQKVEGFARYVREHFGHVEWLWIDTCCINQNISQEVTMAVNSMFRWYSNAEVCLAYLADVSNAKDEHEFQRSEWFRRGWTLQELLAPSIVVFVSHDWDIIGHKDGRGWTKSGFQVSKGRGLESAIATVTGVPEYVLHNYDRSKSFSTEARMAWIAGRETTRGEDMSYSLLGIFDVTMPIIYGEGAERARKRLLEGISKASTSSRAYTSNYEDHWPGWKAIAPHPTHNIPFRRDPDFVDRGTLISQIFQKLACPTGRAGLIGLGGVGYVAS